jgi:hypothetical protein
VFGSSFIPSLRHPTLKETPLRLDLFMGNTCAKCRTPLRLAVIKPHATVLLPSSASTNRQLASGVADSRIETAFNRLKDFRRIATRYDRLAENKSAWLQSALPPLSYGGFNESGRFVTGIAQW